MVMFRGRSSHVLDAKGRLSIPARFREILRGKYDGRIVVTNHPACLAAYPFEEWRALEENFAASRFARPEVQSFQRYFLASAEELPVDAQGRILIPPTLREEAGIARDVILLGMLKYFEIWSKDRLGEELRKARENFDQYSRYISTMESGGQSGN